MYSVQNAALPPVVSKSDEYQILEKILSRDHRSDRQGVVEIRPAIAEHTPGLPVPARLIPRSKAAVSTVSVHAIRFGHFFTGRRGDER